jgi:TPR repeat protein
MAMSLLVTTRRSLLLLGVAVATLSLGCSDFDRQRVRAHLGDRGAQVLVGHAYELGEDVPQDLEAAADWFQRAVDQGQPQAFARLGKLYAIGAGVPQDLLQAHTYFELGFRHGQLQFGIYVKHLEISLTTAEIAKSLENVEAWEASH